MKQLGFFDLVDHLKRLSDAGDPLLDLGRIIDFEAFRPVLDIALDYSDGAKGGHPFLRSRGDVQSAGSGGAEQCQRRAVNAGAKFHHSPE